MEKTAYDGNKAADESAVGLIEQAMAVLNKFYEDNGLALFQAPGEAPPPPPQTGSEPYGGAQDESNGIQGILGLIKEDVEKDIKVATSEEEDAIKEFETLESETASTISLLEDEIANFDDQKGGAEQAITDQARTRRTRSTTPSTS